jgi:hypothetical protein
MNSAGPPLADERGKGQPERQDDRGHHHVPDYLRELGHHLWRADGIAEADVHGLVNQCGQPRAEKRRHGQPVRWYEPTSNHGQQKC